jgi:hypothetical protein
VYLRVVLVLVAERKIQTALPGFEPVSCSRLGYYFIEVATASFHILSKFIIHRLRATPPYVMRVFKKVS